MKRADEDLDAGPSNRQDDKTDRKRTKTANTTSGIHCGLPGNEFQILTTMYVLLRAYNEFQAPDKDFKLHMERTDAGKLDDISLELNGERLFVQVKHTSTASRITKGELLPGTTKGRKDGSFSLYKYYESFRQINQTGKACCVILTNYTVSDQIKDWFEKGEVEKVFANVIKIGQHFRFRNETYQNNVKPKLKEHIVCDAENSFVDNFILSVIHMEAETLQKKIESEIEDNIDEDAEHVFHRLKSRITKWVCDGLTRKLPISKTWLKDFFNSIKEDYKSITNAYYQEFIGRLDVYKSIAITTSQVDIPTNSIHGKNVIVLGFTRSCLVRLLQSKQLCGDQLFSFVPLGRLRDRNTKRKLLASLAEDGTKRNRLVIVLDDNDKEAYLKEFDWFLDNSKNTSTIIVVSKNAMKIQEKCNSKNIHCTVVTDEITLADLSEESRTVLLERRVKFQGVETTLQLLPNQSALEKHICGTELESLLNDVPFNIGKSLPNVPDLCPYYFPRILCYYEYWAILNHLQNDEQFIVIRNIEQISDSYTKEYVLLVDNEEQGSSIKESDCKGQVVHVFLDPKVTGFINASPFNERRNESNVIWIMSYRNIESIRNYLYPYVLKSIGEGMFHKENQLNSRKATILAGEVGTGKTTTWLQLANLQKQSDCSTWIVFLNLSEGVVATLLDQIKKRSTPIDIPTLEELLQTVIAEQDQLWVREYFRNCLHSCPQQVCVYMDGFDEICPTYKEVVVKIARKLIEIDIQHIFISTRKYMEKELENDFLTFSYFLQHLTNEEQKHYLMETIEAKRNYDEQRISQLIDNLQNIIDRSTMGFTYGYFGAPLAMQMLARILNDLNYEHVFSHQFTIHDLFVQFAANLFKRYCIEKQKLQLELNSIQIELPEKERTFYRDLSLVAMKWLYNADDLQQFLTSDELSKQRDILEKPVETTTIRELIIEPPRFIHRSYAEYFAALSIYDKFDRCEDVKQFWNTFERIMTAEGLVGPFFFYKLEAECAKGSNPKVCRLFPLVAQSHKLTAVRYVCQRNFVNSLKCLLQNDPTFTDEDIELTVKHGSLELVKVFAENGANIDIVFKSATQFKKLAIMQYLLEEKLQLNRLNTDGQQPLHVAAQFGDIDAADLLIEKGANVNAADRSGCTPAFLAFEKRQFHMVSFLLDRGASFKSVNVNDDIRTARRPKELFKQTVSVEDYRIIKPQDFLLWLLVAFVQDDGTQTSLQIVHNTNDLIVVLLNAASVFIATNLSKVFEHIMENIAVSEQQVYVIVTQVFDDTNMLHHIANTPEEEFLLKGLFPSSGVRFKVLNPDLIEQERASDPDLIKTNQCWMKAKLLTITGDMSYIENQIMHSIQRKLVPKHPLYSLIRLRHMAKEFMEGKPLTSEQAKETKLQLKKEMLQLYCTEARLKYRCFQFQQSGFLELPQTYPLIVGSVVESAKLVKYLGTQINFHAPGWFLLDSDMRTLLLNEISFAANKKMILMVHHLDCTTELLESCEECKEVQIRCKELITKIKDLQIIVSLKHHQPDQLTSIEVFDEDTQKAINDCNICFQANSLTLGTLDDYLLKCAITSGALEYIALNKPIRLGQAYPTGFTSWSYSIERRLIKMDKVRKDPIFYIIENARTVQDIVQRVKNVKNPDSEIVLILTENDNIDDGSLSQLRQKRIHVVRRREQFYECLKSEEFTDSISKYFHTFNEMLVDLLKNKLVVIAPETKDSSDKGLCIFMCSKCSMSKFSIFEPDLITFVASEISWCHKDKWVIAVKLTDLSKFKQPDPINTLLCWYRYIDDDSLSRSCLRHSLQNRPADVILVIDARCDLNPVDLSLLKSFASIGFYSTVVIIDAAQQTQVEEALSVSSNKLIHSDYTSHIDSSKGTRMSQLPYDARVCEHSENDYSSLIGRYN